MTKISIITPSFNRESYVSHTLDSLLQQTFTDWENIIVDDGSTDKTKEIIAQYARKDSRIKLYDRTREPKGACTCRNEAVDMCLGEYVIFLDTDDLLEKFCLEQRIKVMDENNDLDFAIFPSLMFFDEPFDLGLWWNIDKPIDELTRQFHQDAICQGTGVIWRKEAFNRIGQWDLSLHLWQDIDLFFRAYIQDYKYQKFFNLPPDLHNRRLESSLSRSNFFENRKTKSRIKVLTQAVDLLITNDKKKYLREARFMTAEIVNGLSRTGDVEGANRLINWAKQRGVINHSELNILFKLVKLRTAWWSRFIKLKSSIKTIESQFQVEDCTLGTLLYTPENIKVT